jgi:chromosome segregation ATPase
MQQENVTLKDEEIAQLRFDKEALENKLRKYASHCQRLEEEKAKILNVLRSCNEQDISSNDISRSVVRLCDKLASLEEECDALSKTEKRASSYLVEIDGLKKENDNLQGQVAELIDKVTKYEFTQEELRQRTESLCREKDALLESLQRMNGESDAAQSGATQKVRYLEQENLQLMIDLKAAKKNLQKAKSELNHYRITSVMNDNTNLSSSGSKHESSKVSVPTKKHSHQESLDKENERINMTINTFAAAAPSVTRDFATKRKEDSSNNPSLRIAPPILSEALEENNDNTQECKQS